MTDDVKDTTAEITDSKSASISEQGDKIITQPSEGETTPETDIEETVSEPSKPAEQTVPYSRFKKAIERRRRAEKELAKIRGHQILNQASFDTDDLSKIRSHPYVQDLEMRDAKARLKAGAEKILADYPDFPERLKKAILRNPRGFVRETTQDVPNGLLDIEDYIQDTLDELGAEKPESDPTKQVPVAGTNTTVTDQGSNINQKVQDIFSKPITEWTEKDEQILDEAQE